MVLISFVHYYFDLFSSKIVEPVVGRAQFIFHKDAFKWGVRNLKAKNEAISIVGDTIRAKLGIV